MSLFILFAIAITPLFKILFELKLSEINELLFAIPSDRILQPSSPIKLLLKFNFVNLHFSSDNNLVNFFKPSLDILLYDKLSTSKGKIFIYDNWQFINLTFLTFDIFILKFSLYMDL